MADDSATQTTLTSALVLGACAVGTALVIALTYTETREPIARSQRAAEEKALLEVIGSTPYDNNLLSDSIELSSDHASALHLQQPGQAWVIRNEGKVFGYIFQSTAPDGYSGAIDLQIGISTQGTLLGVRAVDHRETPGLGDKIDVGKSDWILGFAGRSLSNPHIEHWAVNPDGGYFDALTGSTITSRAVVNMVRESLLHYDHEAEYLMNKAQQPLQKTSTHGFQ